MSACVCKCIFGGNRKSVYVSVRVSLCAIFYLYRRVRLLCWVKQYKQCVRKVCIIQQLCVAPLLLCIFDTMRGKMMPKGCNSSATPAKRPLCVAALDPYKRHQFLCLQGFFFSRVLVPSVTGRRLKERRNKPSWNPLSTEGRSHCSKTRTMLLWPWGAER